MKSIVDTAHSFGCKVTAHAHGKEGIDAASRAGVDSIEHGSFIDDETASLKARRSGWLKALCSENFRRTAMPMGNIITVVAVFEIHRLMNAVASMNQSTMRRGLAPMTKMMPSAMRRCRPHCCMVAAISMPPRNSQLTGSGY